VFVGIGFQIRRAWECLVGTMPAGLLVVAEMLIRAMRVLVSVMMFVDVPMLVRVFMSMRLGTSGYDKRENDRCSATKKR